MAATDNMANTPNASGLTARKIPCCICGSLIFPNAANQCGSCLAQDYDLSTALQKGPGNADYSTIHQCRQCRRYQQTPKNYIHAEPESPELLALCLKHIPALQDGSIRILDASWVWTEPHSMRFKLRITAQTEIQNVTVQQRVMVELRCSFQMCQDCNREYTNRTWQAVLQVRQRHTTKGMRALEMAIAKADAKVRKHVLRLDSTNAGLDFYFMELRHAQLFCQFIASQYPTRTKTTQKLVSTDDKNNTANVKYTLCCELASLSKDDLIIMEAKQIPSSLAGRLAMITHVSPGLIQCVDAITMERVDVSADTYYKYEKLIHPVKYPTIRCVVLDVEPVEGACQQQHRKQRDLYEVQLLHSNDDIVTVTTHVGVFLTAGDTVLVYDVQNSVVSIQDKWLQHAYDFPDVVIVKKTKPLEEDLPETEVPAAGKKRSKKKERQQRKENRRMKELEERAARMGFVEAEEDLSNEIEDEVARLERELHDYGSDAGDISE